LTEERVALMAMLTIAARRAVCSRLLTLQVTAWTRDNPNMISPGDRAPRFTLNDLERVPRSLAELLARGPVLLAFYKISCPVCQMTLPFLNRMAGGALQVVTISQDEGASTRRFQTRFGVTLPVLLDQEEENYPVSNAFGITHVPTLFLIEPDGIVSQVSEGFSKADLESLSVRAEVSLFRQDETVPPWKAG
jgi:peroxiredoxin